MNNQTSFYIFSTINKNESKLQNTSAKMDVNLPKNDIHHIFKAQLEGKIEGKKKIIHELLYIAHMHP